MSSPSISAALGDFVVDQSSPSHSYQGIPDQTNVDESMEQPSIGLYNQQQSDIDLFAVGSWHALDPQVSEGDTTQASLFVQSDLATPYPSTLEEPELSQPELEDGCEDYYYTSPEPEETAEAENGGSRIGVLLQRLGGDDGTACELSV